MPTQLDVRPTDATEVTVGLDEPYNVFLWNDPVTTVSVVVYVLQKVFGYSAEKAGRLMLEAHTTGKTVVWRGERNRAVDYCLALGTHGLQATIGKDV